MVTKKLIVSLVVIGLMLSNQITVLASGKNKTTTLPQASANTGSLADTQGGHEVVFGVVASLPAFYYLGSWIIDGIEYTVTTQTVLKQKNGTFAVGVQVKVAYFLDSQNNRIAYQIETWH